MDRINKQNAEYFGTENQMIVLGEELGELSQAAAKWLRLYRSDPTLRDSAEQIREKLLEELADVDIMTEQIRHLLGITEKQFHEVRSAKIKRTAERIAAKGANANEQDNEGNTQSELRGCAAEDKPPQPADPRNARLQTNDSERNH